jgi:hypothetical protein
MMVSLDACDAVIAASVGVVPFSSRVMWNQSFHPIIHETNSPGKVWAAGAIIVAGGSNSFATSWRAASRMRWAS